MWKAALVSAVALTTGMVSSSVAQSQFETDVYEGHASHQSGPRVTETHIARLKAVLNLTPHQQPYWGPVESALRALARHQRQEASAGFVQRWSDRATSMASTAVQLRRLSVAARPLARSLDDSQKQNAIELVRRMGFEHLVAAAF